MSSLKFDVLSSFPIPEPLSLKKNTIMCRAIDEYHPIEGKEDI
jgi:hypothetical protein